MRRSDPIVQSTWRRATTALLAIVALPLAAATSWHRDASGYRQLHCFSAPEARQGVAADSDHIYVVGDAQIAKYSKRTYVRVGAWRARKGDSIQHLNSATVVGGLLYCAHSNYPRVPMESSVEIFDAERMVHVRSVVVPGTDGSLTWIVRNREGWLACFAHYSGRGGEIGRDASCSRVVQLDGEWRRVREWRFPSRLIDRFDGYSSSGGAIGPDGRLHVAGHDRAELYVMDFPAEGSELVWTRTLRVRSEGQGFDWDHTVPGVLYTISRVAREVHVGRIEPAEIG